MSLKTRGRLSYTRKGSDILTPNQKKVMSLVAAAQSNEQIAAEMGITVGTVRDYMKRLYLKTQARNRIHLVIKFFDVLMNVS